MRKEEVTSLFIYFIMVAAGIIVGLTAVQKAMAVSGISHQFIFMIGVILIAFLVNIVGLELLHIIGAKAGGYNIASVNILRFCFEKRGKKVVFRFTDFDGLTGETKVVPKKDKLNPNLYVWFPLFGYAAEIATCIVLYINAMKDTTTGPVWIGAASVVFILISSMLALYNFVPLRLDSMADGYRMVLFANPTNVKAYNERLTIEDLHRQGKDVENVTVYEEVTSYTAGLNMIAVYNFLDKGKLDDADKVITLLLNNKNVLGNDEFYRLIAQKLYIAVLTDDIENVKKLYDEICPDSIRRYIANDVSMESIRAYILIAGMIEESEGEVLYAKSKLEKAKKRSLPARVKVEEKLFNKAIELVYEKHPNWKKENIAN